MKKAFTLGTLLLGCCLAAVAQAGSTPNQTPPTATPPTFPQDQTGQTPSNPTSPSNPSAIPPDTSATGQASQQTGDQSSNSQIVSVQGCLSRASDGNFKLASNSGSNFGLRGDDSELNSYVGNEVSVIGRPVPNSGSTAGAMSSSTSDPSAAGGEQLSVTHVRKVSDVCTSGGGGTKQQ